MREIEIVREAEIVIEIEIDTERKEKIVTEIEIQPEKDPEGEKKGEIQRVMNMKQQPFTFEKEMCLESILEE